MLHNAAQKPLRFCRDGLVQKKNREGAWRAAAANAHGVASGERDAEGRDEKHEYWRRTGIEIRIQS
jgi:hypothetical protein